MKREQIKQGDREIEAVKKEIGTINGLLKAQLFKGKHSAFAKTFYSQNAISNL